jgi:hypothetical protein
MNLDFDKNEILRIFHVAVHALLFLQMITWTLHTKHEHMPLRAVRLVWAALTLLLAVITWHYWYLFSYAVVNVLWHIVIVAHLFLIKQAAKVHNCHNCPNCPRPRK